MRLTRTALLRIYLNLIERTFTASTLQYESNRYFLLIVKKLKVERKKQSMDTHLRRPTPWIVKLAVQRSRDGAEADTRAI